MRTFLRSGAGWLVWAVVFTLPWQGSVLVPGMGTVTRGVGLLAAAAGGVVWVAHGRARRLLDVHLLLLALVGWAMLSLLWSADASRTLGAVVTYLQLGVLLVLLWDHTVTLVAVRRLLWAWVVGGYLGAIGVLTAAGVSVERSTAFGFDENDLGSILALGVPMAWYLAGRGGRPWTRVLAAGYVLVGSLAVLLTGSRGALLVLLAAVLLTAALASTRSLPVRAGVLAGLLVVGVALLMLVPPQTQARLATLPDEVRAGDLNDRTPLWAAAVEIIADHPVLGTGAGTSDVGIAARRSVEMGVHDTYLAIGAELGLVGLALFALALLAAWRRTRAAPPRVRGVASALLLTLLLAMTPLHWQQQKAVWVLVGLVVAWSDAAVREGAPRHRRSSAVPRGHPDPLPQPSHQEVGR